MTYLKNDYCVFTNIKGDITKLKNIIAVSLFKVKKDFKNFNKYINGILLINKIMKSMNKILNKEDKFTLRLYIDDNIYNDKAIFNILNNIENISLIKFSCCEFLSKKNEGHHIGLFGTLIRYYQFFDFEKNDARHILLFDADIDEKQIYVSIYNYLLSIKNKFYNEITMFYNGNYLRYFENENILPNKFTISYVNPIVYNNKLLPYLVSNSLIIYKKINKEIFIDFMKRLREIIDKEPFEKKDIWSTYINLCITDYFKYCDQNICYGIDEYFLNQFLLKYLVENNYNVAYYTQHNISNILYILRLAKDKELNKYMSKFEIYESEAENLYKDDNIEFYVELYENIKKHPDYMINFIIKLLNQKTKLNKTPKNYKTLAFKIIKLFNFLYDKNILRDVINDVFHAYFKMVDFKTFFYIYDIKFTNNKESFVLYVSAY